MRGCPFDGHPRFLFDDVEAGLDIRTTT